MTPKHWQPSLRYRNLGAKINIALIRIAIFIIIIIMSFEVYNNFVNYMVGLPEVCLFLEQRMDVNVLGILEPFIIKQGY
jgi:hypothetical protein